VKIPFDRGDLVSLAHQRCFISREAYDSKGTIIEMRVPAAYAPAFGAYALAADES